MQNIQYQFKNLLKNINSIEEGARSKELAKLGDEIINMVYSLAYSLFIGKPTGEKVNATVLAESMRQSDLRKYAKSRAKTHDIADSAEAIIAYYFLKNKISIEMMVSKVLEGLGQYKNQLPFKTIKEKRDADISGLLNLLKYIKKEIIEN
ncbi:MAG: ribonuclease III family protein [Promethearchaeota archaeon]